MIRTYNGTKPKVAATAFVEASAKIIGDVEIGEHSSVWFNCVIRGDVNQVRIGHSTNVQDGSIIHVASGRFPTVIGNYVTVGHGVMLHGCTIKDRSLIGIGSIILDGSIVGEESIVAAGSLVAPGTVIPPRTLVMGSPARARREVTDEDVANIDAHWKHYIDYKNSYLAEAADRFV
jgi:carbonic anhydrase/acetyltransferase-like protein (isoleucine patch superfamily)